MFLWRRSTSRWSCSDQLHLLPQRLQGLDNGIQPRPHLVVRDLPKHQIVQAGVEKSGKVDQNIQRTAALAGLDLRQMDGAVSMLPAEAQADYQAESWHKAVT